MPPMDDTGDRKLKPQTEINKELMQQFPGVTKFEKFQFMRGMTYSEEQIRKYLSLTHKAFELMDDRANRQVESYLRYQAKSGYIQNITNALSIQWMNVFALQKRAIAAAKQANDNEKDRKLVYAEAHIRNVLNEALKVVTDMQEKTPTVSAFNLFIKENIIEGGGGNKKNRANKLPVTPEELTN